MRLTDSVCAHARPKAKPFKLFDGEGLYLFIAPSGGKLWRFDYRFLGKRRTVSLGSYPVVRVSDARLARDTARAQLAEGADPVAERRVAKRTAEFRARATFGLVAAEVLDKLERERKAETTIKKRRWLLTNLAADLTDRPVARITAPEILAVLQKAESRGHLESARRLRATIGQVMRHAVATGRAEHDPTPALRGAIAVPVVTHRAAIIEPARAGKLLAACAGYDKPVVRHALLLSAYCFPRPGELRLATWDEIDIKAKLWRIPAARTKMRREHRIPLSPQAVREFMALRRLTGSNVDGLCFPGLRPGRPMSENTINAALRTLGFDTSAEHCAHGFRSLASTLLNEHSPFSADAIERALGHLELNAVRRAYHRAEYMAEREKLMVWWANYLDELRERAEVRALI